MGKRSAFDRIPRDFYPTPREAVLPLLPHLREGDRFWEPCAGNGALIDHLTSVGLICARALDIEPQRADIDQGDCFGRAVGNIDYIITNPPWDREILHPMITHFSWQAPAWLLFDADWIHTKQSAPFMPLLKSIVSVGRVKWIAESKMTGKDNCAWYCFDARNTEPPRFYGRTACLAHSTAEKLTQVSGSDE